MNFIQTPYYKIHLESSRLMWKYFEVTNFFSDLLEITLFNQKTIDDIIGQKSNEFYRPKNFDQLLKKPDFTPLQVEKIFPQPE